MNAKDVSHLPAILQAYEHTVLTKWIDTQLDATTMRRDLISERDLRNQSQQFLHAFSKAVAQGDLDDIITPLWDEVRDALDNLSRTRALQGFSPAETAAFIFSLKQPLITHLREKMGNNPDALVDEIWQLSTLLDKLGLYVTEAYQQSREEIIRQQQQELLELSTPVVKLWEGLVALPLIGTLDSSRTQVVMENLLQAIVDTGATMAIIDITGVPVVDTLVAQHLLKTVAAARLMGADCIISGIRPQIAQTIVHLGIDLQNIITKSTLADAFALALHRLRFSVVKIT